MTRLRPAQQRFRVSAGQTSAPHGSQRWFPASGGGVCGQVFNRLVLLARLSMVQALRYSPAGVAILDAEVHTECAPLDAGVARQLSFTMAVRFTEDLAHEALRLPLGSMLSLEGFLAPTRLHAKTLRFHVQRLQVCAT